MKKILIVFGTRPEAIKMLPIIRELEVNSFFMTTICVTSQHNELLKEVLDLFNIKPDFDLEIMKPNQTLFDITNSILSKIEKVYEVVEPDIVLVHGDTTTAFVASLAAFYKRIDVGHIEAGLRTHDIYSPYPEEFNRQAVSLLAKYHFAPTEFNRSNLINNGVEPKNVYVTGNTVIDVFQYTLEEGYSDNILDWLGKYKLIILTAHRRETSVIEFKSIFETINKIIEINVNFKLLYPVHPNPRINQIAKKAFKKNKRVMITPPLDIVKFHNLMAQSFLIITDSGGIQEEAPSLNIPVLVLRDKTERTEALEVGAIKLIGTSPNRIKQEIENVLYSNETYQSMAGIKNPYGDGMASKRIIKILETNLSN